jgi:hypothetical protein
VTRLLYLIGPPGAGKSATMDQVVLQLGLDWLPDERVWRELWVNPLADVSGQRVGLALGKRRPSFPGTDALSMSASPQVLKWMANGSLPEIILGEGARLGTPKFLMQADEYASVTLVHLTARPETLEARCEGKGLSDTYRRGRTSASASCYEAVMSLGIPSLEIWTDQCTPAAVAETIIWHWNDQR